jgi:adenylate cyclase
MSDTGFDTAPARSTRRLAAILAADVVGYSRMMAKDETGTLVALKRHREGLFDPTVAAHNGRIVKLIGDGTLVEFPSVVDAVRCALAIQMAPKGPGPENLPIVLRIGVNLGDIIIDGDDIYGDGVNVAARLEPLAEPGGICIASIVRESVGNRLDVDFNDGGEVSVKNIERPIRIWRWKPDSKPAPQPRAATASLFPAPSGSGTNSSASIAVLPFSNMSGDAEQEYFSDGITEDIITDLSKVGGLAVIARNSTFVYKGKSVDIRAVGRELGVKSVLEGSIRRAGNRVRITAQLIDADSGAHLWAERYDRDLTDIFAVQDDVTRQIVSALKVALTPAEKAQLATGIGGGTSNFEALDCLLKARQLLTQPSKDKNLFRDSIALLERALALDPQCADAVAGLSMAYNLDFHNRWSDDPDGSLRKALELAERAVAMDPSNPFPHYCVAVVATFVRDLDRALRETELTLKISPNSSYALNARGVVRIYLGQAEAAIPDIELALRLDPGFAQQYLHFLGVAHFVLKHFEAAEAHFRARIRITPETDLTRGLLVATLGHLGKIDEARQVWGELKAINPTYSFAGHIGRLAFSRQADVDLIMAGFAKTGITE